METDDRSARRRVGEPAGFHDAGEEGESAPSGEIPSAARTAGELEDECRDLRERWLRAEAELANYRRRVARDLEEAERRAKERILAEVLSLADDLERALDAAERAEEAGPIYQGVRLVHERVRDIMRTHGVEVIDPLGKPFDPHLAEALLEVETSQAPPGTVVSVVEKGYRVGERLLRPAKVTVARRPGEGGQAGARAEGRPEDTGGAPRTRR